jgi:hypothetical protein
MYNHGGGVERASPVFRAALARVADYETVYSAWTIMERRAGAAAAAREVYEEWRARRAVDGGGGQEADSWFWRSYLDLELNHGDAERARAVAEVTMAACPGDVMLRAECVLAEAQLGDDERARAVFDSALSAFAGDLEAKARLREQVRKGASSLSERRLGCFLFCRGCCFFRPLRWWDQI